MSRFRRLTLASAALAVLPMFAAPPAAQAAPAQAVTFTMARSASAVPAQATPAAAAPVLLKWRKIDVLWYNTKRGYIEIYVYSNHRKHLVVCDIVGEGHEPTLQVDPSGAAEPISYQDPNGSHAGCLVHDIGYSVRKFRAGYHKEGNATQPLFWGDWFSAPPLPYPDF